MHDDNEVLNALYDAITALFNDYRTEGCSDPECSVCRKSKAAFSKAIEAQRMKEALDEWKVEQKLMGNGIEPHPSTR